MHLTYLIGTGKSVLLRRIISEMKIKYSKYSDAVAVTAPTGIAACNVGGVTIHSFSGIGLGNGDVSQLATKIKRNHKARSRWSATKVLIIDEGETSNISRYSIATYPNVVSMMDGDLFDKLERIARELGKNRNTQKPFGGIQVCTCWVAPIVSFLTTCYLAGHCRRFLPVASGIQGPTQVCIRGRILEGMYQPYHQPHQSLPTERPDFHQYVKRNAFWPTQPGINQRIPTKACTPRYIRQYRTHRAVRPYDAVRFLH